ELAVHRRAMHADLLEHSAAHQGHNAAATGAAGVIGALPRRAGEAASRTVGERRIARQASFEGLEFRANVVAQPFEPALCARLTLVENGGAGEGCWHGYDLIHAEGCSSAASLHPMPWRQPW